MSTTLTWEDHRIDITSRMSSKYWWLATEQIVMIDGQEIARTGGLSFTESAIGKFTHAGQSCVLELQTAGGLFTLSSLPYVLRINGLPVASGDLHIENLASAVVAHLGLLLLLGLLGFAIGYMLIHK